MGVQLAASMSGEVFDEYDQAHVCGQRKCREAAQSYGPTGISHCMLNGRVHASCTLLGWATRTPSGRLAAADRGGHRHDSTETRLKGAGRLWQDRKSVV